MHETRTLEFKEKITNTFLKTVSAFSNYNGGTILFGVDDDGNVKGLPDIKQACLDIENKINDSISPQPNYMRYIIDSTKTSAGTRKLPITQDVANMFRAIIEDREAPKYEKIIDGYSGFLFVDKNGNPLVAMHWQHRLNHMVKRYNDIYRVQMPNITPHVCRHTYCSNMAKSGMNPKTLQYLMGHSDIAVTLNVYTHIGLDDATEELRKLEEMENARRELEKGQEKPVSKKMFKAI